MRSGRASARSGHVSAASINSPKIKVDNVDNEIKEVDPQDFASRRSIQQTFPADEEVRNPIL